MFRYYIIAIVSGSALIFGANALFVVSHTPFSVMHAFIFTVLSVVEAFLIDAAVALLVRYAVPKSYYHPLKRRYACARWEKKVYVKLGIRKWKDKIPETGGLLVGFPKDKVLDMHDNSYIFRFMEETCYAEVMHVWSAVLGFAVLALCPAPLRMTVALPVTLVNLILQILPVAVQRFVRPQLLRIYNSNSRRDQSRLSKNSGCNP